MHEIQPVQTERAASIVLDSKKDGDLRFCIDYRKLSAFTARDCYPLPRMDECIDLLGDAKVFSTLHANSGYLKAEVDKED